MYRLLLLTTSVALVEQFATVLRSKPFVVTQVASAAEAKKVLSLQSHDAVFIDEELSDSSGLHLAEALAKESEMFVILFAEQTRLSAIQELLLEADDEAVLILEKPTDINLLQNTVKLLLTGLRRLDQLRKHTAQLEQKLEDMKILNRAKLILMEVLKLNEAQAHKFIERQAMQRRISKRLICESIIRTYR